MGIRTTDCWQQKGPLFQPCHNLFFGDYIILGIRTIDLWRQKGPLFQLCHFLLEVVCRIWHNLLARKLKRLRNADSGKWQHLRPQSNSNELLLCHLTNDYIFFLHKRRFIDFWTFIWSLVFPIDLCPVHYMESKPSWTNLLTNRNPWSCT